MDANIKDYQNIALFGVDSQDNKIKDKGSRTDCIIIASINKSTKKVKLMSIYRDTYVSIDGEYDKINRHILMADQNLPFAQLTVTWI